jgi:adenosylcobinamide-GDP ribazoletransferase
MIHRILVALGFLTIIPIKRQPKDEKDLATSASFFPFVGLFIGGILLLVDYVGRFVFLEGGRSLILIGVWVLLTGGLHLDGFIDTVDGIWGGTEKEEILRIMRDPKIGVMGTVCLFLLLGLKVCFLLEILYPLRYKVILLAPTLGRWAMVSSVYFSRPVREDGKGRLFLIGIGRREFLVSSLLPFLGGYWAFGKGVLFLLAMVSGLVGGIVWFMRWKIGGMTGDTIGFVCELTELLTLGTIAAMGNLLT